MRRILRTNFLYSPAFLLLVSLACSSAATAIPTAAPVLQATPQPEPTATPVPTAIPKPAPTPVISTAPSGKSGGSLTVAAMADAPHRDVHQERQETLTTLGPGLAYSRLLRLRSGPEVKQPSLLLECDLCQSWELTNDFAYQFKLRPGVQWQDLGPVYGRELVADDLVYSYNRIQTPGWPNSTLFSDRGIGGFEALDHHTLLVSLTFLDSDALLSLADGHSKIVAREVVEQYGDLRNSPVVGTGPWIWEETTRGGETTFSANTNYFEPGLPFLDQLVIKVVKPSHINLASSQVRLAAFQAGQLDVLTLPPKDWQQIEGGNPDFNAQITQRGGSGLALTLNVQTPPFDDLAVRQAVLKAIDPWDYIDLMWAGQGTAGIGVPVPDPSWLLTAEELRDNYFASPSEARDLLMGTGQQLPINIEVSVGEFDGLHLQLGRRVVQDLKAVGFNPTLRAVHPSYYNELLLNDRKAYQLALGTLPPVSTPNGFLLGFLHSRGPANLADHRDGTLNLMIEQQASELDQDLRREQLAQIQRRVLEQGYMFSPALGSSQWVFNRELRGFYPNTALSEYNYWSRAWLER